MLLLYTPQQTTSSTEALGKQRGSAINTTELWYANHDRESQQLSQSQLQQLVWVIQKLRFLHLGNVI